MVRFRIFGIPVEVQPWFWLMLAIFGGIDKIGNPDALLYLCLFILAGFVSILVHELGHALVGKAYGADPEISLNLMGGLAAFPAGRFTRKQDFLVTAAGPFVQILLGLAAFAVLLVFKEQLTGKPLSYFFSILMVISFFWAILNLVPVLPLDGGRMLHAILGPSRVRITLWISIVSAIVCGILLLMRMGTIIFPIYLGMFAYQSWQALQQLPRR